MSIRDFILTMGKKKTYVPQSIMHADLQYGSKLPPGYDSTDRWYSKRYYLTLHVETWYTLLNGEDRENEKAREIAVEALSHNLFGEYRSLVLSAQHAVMLGEKEAAMSILNDLRERMHVRYIEGGNHGSS
jgi:hypothetical protein